MKKVNDIIYFDNDIEFENYALSGTQICKSEYLDGYTYSICLTDTCNRDIENGCKFVICDESSQITKHNAINKGACVYKFNNILPYYGEKYNKIN